MNDHVKWERFKERLPETRQKAPLQCANHYMHGRDLPVNIWGRPHFIQRQRKRPRSSTTQNTRPSPSPSHARADLQNLWNGARFGCGQTGQEMGCFRRPTPSDLACDDHQVGTTVHSSQFRIGPSLCVVWPPSRPLRPALWLRVWACRLDADTNVVSIASCAPPNNGRPSATISNLRASTWSCKFRSRSRTRTLVITRAPGKRSLRSRRVRKTEGSNFVRRLVGNARNGAAARGPPCDRNIAWSVGDNVDHLSERCWISRLRAANFCHPC